MKSSCSAISKLLEKYFDQEVTNEEKLLVEAHLLDCQACQDALRSMEELRTLMKVPVEEAVEREDFPWVWQKIERGIRSQERPTLGERLRTWLHDFPFLRRKVLIPAVASVIVLLFAVGHLLFPRIPSYPAASAVEYVDSPAYNVMVYPLEDGKTTVIWLFEEQEEATSS